MNKNIQDYIVRRKKQFLINEGLYDKVFEPTIGRHNPNEFPESEIDFNNKVRYYKIIPYDITDEEFDSILRLHIATNYDKSDNKDERVIATHPHNANKDKSNHIAVLIKVIAIIIYIIGFIAGIFVDELFGKQATLSWITVLIWFASVVYGSLLLGLSEIIKLLHCQKD